MGLNWGALAGGAVKGAVLGMEMKRAGEQDARAKERDKRDGELHAARMTEVQRTARERDRQEGAMRDLSRLLSGYLTPRASVTAGGVLPAAESAAAPDNARSGGDSLPREEAPALTEESGYDADAPQSVTAAEATVLPAASASAAAPAAAPKAAPETFALPSRVAAEGLRGMPGVTEKPRPKTPDDVVGYGLWRTNGSPFRDPAFTNRAAKIVADAGYPEQGLAWLRRGEEAAREGGIDALRRLIGGDVAGAERAFNASGTTKVMPGTTRDVGKGQFEITLADGQKQIINPRQQLRSYLSPRDFLQLEIKDAEVEIKRGEAESRAGERVERSEDRRERTEEMRRNNRAMGDFRAAMLATRQQRGADAATALERNVNYLVKNGIARDPSDAYRQLRTASEKPTADAIVSLANSLVKGSGYRGRDGMQRALNDARGMIESLKSPDDVPSRPTAPAGTGQPSAPPVRGASRYKSPDDVRGALRAGRIDRQTAEQVLRQNFGFQ